MNSIDQYKKIYRNNIFAHIVQPYYRSDNFKLQEAQRTTHESTRYCALSSIGQLFRVHTAALIKD